MTDPVTSRHGREQTTVLPGSTRVRVQRGRLIYGGTEYDIGADELVVGSGPDSDIFVQDPTVSRRHFGVSHKEQQYLIRDLGSTNGTQVDGVGIKEGFLRGGSSITAGNVTFRFESEPEPAEIL